MVSKDEETLKYHKKFAVEFNNSAWDFFEMDTRTEEQTLDMLHMAHASRFHWGVVGTPMNLERGEWLVSRAYSEAGVAERAIFHGNNCLSICLENSIGDFDLAFAYEGLTRAWKLDNNEDKYKKYKKLALEAGEKIGKKEDKDYFMQQINSL